MRISNVLLLALMVHTFLTLPTMSSAQGNDSTFLVTAYNTTRELSTTLALRDSSQPTSTKIMSIAPTQKQNNGNTTVVLTTLIPFLTTSSTHPPKSRYTSATTAGEVATEINNIFTENYSTDTMNEATKKLSTSSELPALSQTTTKEMMTTAPTNAGDAKATLMPLFMTSLTYSAEIKNTSELSSATTAVLTTRIKYMMTEKRNPVSPTTSGTGRSNGISAANLLLLLSLNIYCLFFSIQCH